MVMMIGFSAVVAAARNQVVDPSLVAAACHLAAARNQVVDPSLIAVVASPTAVPNPAVGACFHLM